MAPAAIDTQTEVVPTKLKAKGDVVHFNPADSERPMKDKVRRVPRSTPIKEIIQIVKEDGGVVIEGFLPPDRVQRLNADIEPYLENFAPGARIDHPAVASFHGPKTKRLTNLVPRSKTWREEVCNDDVAHGLAEELFRQESGDYWQGTAQVIDIGPGSPAQTLHHDFGSFPVYWHMGPDSPEAMMNILIALTDTTEENGATRVIPGSHKWNIFDMGDPSLTVPATLKAGDCLLITGKVVHGGGANNSDKSRRVISWNFIPSFLCPEEAHTLLIPLDLVKTLPERAQRTLGFRSQYPKESIGLWMCDLEEVADHIGL